jgi:hypothetical protein
MSETPLQSDRGTLEGHREVSMTDAAFAARQTARADLKLRLSNCSQMPTGHPMSEICNYHKAGDELWRAMMGTSVESEGSHYMWKALKEKSESDKLLGPLLNVKSLDEESVEKEEKEYYSAILKKVKLDDDNIE